MEKQPRDCTVCEYENCCNSAMYLEGCRFYPPMRKISLRKSIITSLKELFK